MDSLLPCSKTDQPNLLLEIVPWQLQAFKLKQPRESLGYRGLLPLKPAGTLGY